jgi:hypothetical protein
MDEIREKLIAVLEAEFEGTLAMDDLAARILDIPEIKTALAYRPRLGGHFDICTKDGGRRWVPNPD